jgi:Phage tail assembly chaperone protein, TAC
MPFAEYHTQLYRIGTGWLGWSPETTWNATPREITEAYGAHVEQLKAIYGAGDQDQDSRTTPDSAPLDRAGLNSLRAIAKAR